MTTDTPVTAPRNAGTTGRISLVGIGHTRSAASSAAACNSRLRLSWLLNSALA